MKKIAIVSKKYGNGGVEKVLVELLKNISYTAYSIDLYLPDVTTVSVYPSRVNIIKMKSVIDEFSLLYLIKHFIQVIFALFNMVNNKYLHCNGYIKQLKNNVYSFYKNDKNYDIAIAYDGPLGFSTFYTLYNIKAKEKYFWVHGSIKGDGIPKKIIMNYYSRFDKLIFVSKATMNEFIETYPEFLNKVDYFYNFFDTEKILDKAACDINPSLIKFERDDSIIITTVARLSYEKGIDIAIEAAKKLHQVMPNFNWYIIGGGNEYSNLIDLIRRYNLEDSVHLLNELDNPLPFVRKCDIYVQPSRTEGFCTSSFEAKILKKPIIVTDVGGMREQFKDKETAIIVKKDDVDELYNAILILGKNKKERLRLTKQIDNQDVLIERSKSIEELIG